MFTLILAERDLGMAMTFLLVVVALLFFAGINMRYIAGLGVFVAAGFTIVFLAGGLRGKRFDTFISAFFGNFADTKSSAFQSYQGFLSLADGSLTGVGLGQSRAKWFYLPEAKNDFIFAIIGEEMGLMGGTLVICLFSWLAYIGFRIAARSAHQFLALTAATLTAGVVAQAFINMGYVVGLLPVTGINLPMISAGGTSAVITLGAMGILANCARHEPDTIAAMANFGKPAFDRVLFLPEPTLDGLERYPAGRRPGGRRTPQTGSDTRTTRDNPNPTVQHPSGPKTGENRGYGAAGGTARSRTASAPTPKKTGFFPGRSRTSQPVRRPLPARTTGRDTIRDPNPTNREVSREVTRTTGRRTNPTTSLGPARTRTSYERHDPRSSSYRTTGRR